MWFIYARQMAGAWRGRDNARQAFRATEAIALRTLASSSGPSTTNDARPHRVQTPLFRGMGGRGRLRCHTVT